MKLIINPSVSHHVSGDVVNEFERSIMTQRLPVMAAVYSSRAVRKATYLLWRGAERSRIRWQNWLEPFLSRPLGKRKEWEFFSVLMGPDFKKCFPYVLLPGTKSVYMFDAWPETMEEIRHFVDCFHLQHAFVTSSQAAERLQGMTRKKVFHWVPEGVDPKLYRQYAVPDRDIDVLALGRKFDAYHERIVSKLEKDKVTYLYERIKGEIVFPTREGFIDGLARSKISICFPCSLTHPKRSGDIETMTNRYLQSMASKCLVVGRAPAEMVRLFGYNPVVEADMNNAVEQLYDILAHFQDFSDLIEKNYRVVLEDHTWKERWRKIIDIIKNADQ